MLISKTLSYYKRQEIRDALLRHAKDKEIAVKFQKGFGKRPDTLEYSNDITELARNGAVSFHCSEELWRNPLQLQAGMKKKDMDNLRKGWDLILDIDSKLWVLAKLTTYFLIRALKEHNVKNISLKFSGNKGFHIGVPWEAFPEKIRGELLKDYFPEGPKRIAQYLIHYISDNYIKVDEEKIIFGKYEIKINSLIKALNKKKEDFLKVKCKKCKKTLNINKLKTEYEYYCEKCGNSVFMEKEKDYIKCSGCGGIAKKKSIIKPRCTCGSYEFKKEFDVSSIMDVDTLLISSRHMYRMPYSYHEKSGLVSLPIELNKLLKFRKNMANPRNIKDTKIPFLEREKAKQGEASDLILRAFDYKPDIEETKINIQKREFEKMDSSLPEMFFPPCIKKGLQGLEDGRKRFLFILVNFLTNLGWNYDEIEKLVKKWNKRNSEELRWNFIESHIRYHKRNKENILPPNCTNNSYYHDLHICTNKDPLCTRIKNPVNYAILKARDYNSGKKNKKND